MIQKFSQLPARVESSMMLTKKNEVFKEEKVKEEEETNESPLSEFLEIYSNTIDALESRLQ